MRIYNVIKHEAVDESKMTIEKAIVASFFDENVAKLFINESSKLKNNEWVEYSIEVNDVSFAFIKVMHIGWVADDDEKADLPEELIIPSIEINHTLPMNVAINEWLYKKYGYKNNGFLHKVF